MNWQALANLALARLFEPPCAACGAVLSQPLAGAVCGLCWRSIHRITPPVCDHCGDPLPSALIHLATRASCLACRDTRHVIDRARAIGPYEGRLRDIVHALKYDRRRSIASRLGAMMREAGADLLNDADCVVPVPLHARRERTRGFNQAEDLARELRLPVEHFLQRVVATRPQVDLPASARHRNVKDAFRLRGSALKSRAHDVLRRGDPRQSPASLVIVLVDDVATTGATLDACAAVLKTNGALSVRALTAARVVSGRP